MLVLWCDRRLDDLQQVETADDHVHPDGGEEHVEDTGEGDDPAPPYDTGDEGTKAEYNPGGNHVCNESGKYYEHGVLDCE